MPSNISASAGQAAGDILEVLRQDHVRVDSLLDQIEETDESDERRREQLFAQVAAEIQVHSDAEDQVVYGALEARAGFENLIEDAREEHEHIEQMVEELDELEVTDRSWLDKVHDLRQLVRHHVDEEEGQLFGRIVESLDAVERRRLAEDFLASKEIEEEDSSAVQPGPRPGPQQDIESLSKKDLYELARNRHIGGRSAMTKAQLVQAIRSAGTTASSSSAR